MNLLFILGEIIAGALLIVGPSWFVIHQLSGSTEEVMAKDLALTISTILASPTDMNYVYYPNTEKEAIIIDDSGKVSVQSDSGFLAKSTFMKIDGTSVKSALIKNKVNIPINFLSNGLSFEKQTYQKSKENCGIIPKGFPKRPSVYIDIYSYPNLKWKTPLNAMKEKLTKLVEADGDKSLFKVTDIESSADIVLILEFEDSNLHRFSAEYYESDTKIGYQRLACFMKVEMESDKKIGYVDASYFSQDTTPQIEVAIDGFGYYEQAAGKGAPLQDEMVLALKKSLDEALK